MLWLCIASMSCGYVPWADKRVCIVCKDKKWYYNRTGRCDFSLHLCFICSKDLWGFCWCFRKVTREHYPNGLLTDPTVAQSLSVTIKAFFLSMCCMRPPTSRKYLLRVRQMRSCFSCFSCCSTFKSEVLCYGGHLSSRVFCPKSCVPACALLK